MTENNDIGTVADQVMNRYQEQLNLMVKQHEEMLKESRAGLEKLIADSNAQMAELVAAVGQPEPAKPMPEVAWVPRAPGEPADHLVLNPEAVALLNKLFTAFNEVLPELAKLVKRR